MDKPFTGIITDINFIGISLPEYSGLTLNIQNDNKIKMTFKIIPPPYPEERPMSDYVGMVSMLIYLYLRQKTAHILYRDIEDNLPEINFVQGDNNQQSKH